MVKETRRRSIKAGCANRLTIPCIASGAWEEGARAEHEDAIAGALGASAGHTMVAVVDVLEVLVTIAVGARDVTVRHRGTFRVRARAGKRAPLILESC